MPVMLSPLHVRTVLRLLLQLLLVIVLIFSLLALSPIDPIQTYLGGNAFGISAQQKIMLIEQLGLNQTMWQQMYHWFLGLSQGEFGFSTHYQQPVINIITERAPLSFMLLGVSACLSLVMGYILGLTAAIHCGRWLDRIISQTAWVLASIPTFWLGLILITLFAIQLSWLPVGGIAPIGLSANEQSTSSLVRHLVLPTITLSLGHMAPIVLHTKEKVLDVLSSEHVHYARLHGESMFGIIRFHVLRNSLVPAIVLSLASFAELFSGSILAETVFNYPGLGSTIVNAGLSGDAPLLLGISSIGALLVFIGNSLANGLSSLLIPARN